MRWSEIQDIWHIREKSGIKRETWIDRTRTSDQLRSLLSNNRRKRSASFIYDNACEHQQNGDYGDYPRSKKQLIDISYSLEKSNVHEVGDLLALNYELQEKIIWHHSDVPSDIWVLVWKQIHY